MKTKSTYADMEKFAEYKRRYQRGYRNRNGANMYGRRRWTSDEDRMVMEMSMPDSELGRLIQRSVGAIEHRRIRLRAKLV